MLLHAETSIIVRSKRREKIILEAFEVECWVILETTEISLFLPFAPSRDCCKSVQDRYRLRIVAGAPPEDLMLLTPRTQIDLIRLHRQHPRPQKLALFTFHIHCSSPGRLRSFWRNQHYCTTPTHAHCIDLSSPGSQGN